jgi:pimeloyl-ACP methyl ester carboxylesterase
MAVSSQTKGTETETVQSFDGVRISYEVTGTGDPTLVFVHGLSCNLKFWESQIPFFSKRHRCVTIDLGGHGRSGIGRKSYTMASFGEDVAAVIKKLDLKKVILVGHSMGGPVIVEAYVRTADRIIGMVGVETFHFVNFGFTEEQVQERVAPFREDYVKAASGYKKFMKSKDQALIDFIIQNMSSHTPAISINAQEELWRWSPMSTYMQGLNVPIYSIMGDWAKPDVDGGKSIGIEFIIMKDAGHFNMMEDPTVFNYILAGVISSF